MPTKKQKKNKIIRAWAVIVYGKIWATRSDDSQWPRIYKTRKEAKKEYPNQKVIAIEVKIISPKK